MLDNGFRWETTCANLLIIKQILNLDKYDDVFKQDLEQMGKEQDKESDKLTLLNKAEGHRKQMLR